jgi:hypothetical protein
MTQGRTGQGMALARRTSERRGQKINAPLDFTLQEKCSHRIRRRTATPEATFFASLSFSRFHPYTANVTQALPLEAIKGGQGPERVGTKLNQIATRIEPPPPLNFGPAPSLESL